jgi:hypothetical protein
VDCRLQSRFAQRVNFPNQPDAHEQDGRIDPNYREIRFGIITDELCRIIAAVRKINDNSDRIVDNMTVSQNEAVRRNYESGAASASLALVAFASLLDLDVRDRRRDPLNCGHYRAGIFVQ